MYTLEIWLALIANKNRTQKELSKALEPHLVALLKRRLLATDPRADSSLNYT